MIKIFGMMRSGTNYLREMIRLNFEEHVLVHELGWKHGNVGDPYEDFRENSEGYESWWRALIEAHLEAKDITPIVIVKSPYSWIKSMEKLHATAVDYTELFGLYNERHRDWATLFTPRFCYRKLIVVRYRDLLWDLEGQMHRIAGFTQMPLKRLVNLWKVEMSELFSEEKKRVYMEPQGDEKVTRLVDWETMRLFGMRAL